MSETKTDQSRTRNAEDQSQERPAAETRVTEGDEGIERLGAFLRHLLSTDKPTSKSSE